MCGICGGVGVDSGSTLEAMAACLDHLGPDEYGEHVGPGVAMANQRLSVIDLKGGSQPIYNEEGDVVVVYNGEIYNFRALRADLESRGHRFGTDTDTEVLVHGYEEWGPGVFERLNGMFAVALWDASEERFLLARDRAGVKPLYYAPVDGRLLFASEPKSILRSGLVAPEVDERALQYFLQLRYAPSDTSLFAGVETLLPGHYVDARRDQGEWSWSVHEYWNPLDAAADPPDDPERAVEDALERAVERQLVSDVPVGFYLSGGLDTSSVVAMAAELSDGPVHTFCMGFDDQEWDERADARVVADHFDTNHHEIALDREFMRDFPRMIWHADEPKRNLYPYYVAEAMSEHVTVALGGLGADELFGGYVYRFSQLQEYEQLRRSMGASETKSIRETAGRMTDLQLEHGDLSEDGHLEELGVVRHVDDPARLYVLLNSTDVIGDIDAVGDRVFGERLDDGFVPADRIRARLPDADDLPLTERALYWDFAVKMPDDFLLVEDRMSMAHSLESRVPFLDNELVSLALSLPSGAKLSSGDENVGKAVLRRAMRDRLPEEVFRKDKQGFTMPTYPFVRDEMLPHAERILDDPSIVRDGLVDGSYVRELLDRPPARELTPHYKMLWKLVALEIWHRMYVVEGVEGPRDIEHYYT